MAISKGFAIRRLPPLETGTGQKRPSDFQLQILLPCLERVLVELDRHLEF